MGRMVSERSRAGRFAGSEDRYPSVRRFAYVLTGDRFEAEDLAQEALVRSANANVDMNDAQSMAYLRTVVLNLWLRGRRNAAKERRAWLRSLRPATDDPMSKMDETERIWRALATLSKDARCCIVLRYYEDLPLAEIAEVLRMPLGTVKSHISRGLDRINLALEVR
jgi:RNA polymerase sigma factor (sigma-70 family)